MLLKPNSLHETRGDSQVIVEYDINDYKAKTELTQPKLFTMLIATLRSYENLVALDRSKIGLSKILNGASNLYELKSLREFASGVLSQVGALLEVGAQGVLCVSAGKVESPEEPLKLSVLAGTGLYSHMIDQAVLPPDHEWMHLVKQALCEKRSIFSHPVDVLFSHSTRSYDFVIVLVPPLPLEPYQRELLGVFCDRIAAAHDNLHMYTELQRLQEAAVVAMADLAESRDADTGGHVQRVCKLTDAITRKLHAAGKHTDLISKTFIEQVGLASMLHDIGKVAIPDAILLKPAAYTPEERQIMEQHALIGERVLQRASTILNEQNYLTIGAEIAGSHHEFFNGEGYPRRLKGNDIPLSGRIVAVVDVVDALLHRRPYKEPWPLEKVIAYLQERSGKQFDPDVVEIFIALVNEENPSWLIDESSL